MLSLVYETLQLLAIDLVFVGIFVLALVPLNTYKRAAFAVLRRNFIGYFSNPTGYVFLCLFVLLTSFFAFWPHEFFNANLANLDELNKVLPLVMLIYIPAITMSIWSEEKRQGTDELLLTLPAGDFDIVIGKYLAAAAIFSASLIFSQVANYFVLVALSLGELDTGLFFTTYLGYWMLGMAMLSLGMVASFLTSNLTVGFILGMVFNVPLTAAKWADLAIPDEQMASLVRNWSMGHQFEDFGRGVVSLSSVSYFFMIIVIGLYFSMVLIGKRHWLGGRDGDSMLGHYAVRCVALVVAALSVSMIFSNWDLFYYDTTEGKVSSLSPKTKDLINNKLEPKHSLKVEAFISARVPELYAQTKYDLMSMLKEFERSNADIEVVIHDDLELFSEEASMAQERFKIEPQMVRTRTRGAIQDDEIIMGAAFSSGLEKVVVPFFDYGVPVEYELVRSLATVAKAKRPRLGVVRTDAQMFGGFSFAGGRPQQTPKQAIIEELEKQYDVEEVDPTDPIEVGQYDALLVVQPSSLAGPQFENVYKAIEAGQPTAIFEDPRPVFLATTPGTGDPKPAPGGGMMGMGSRPQPKDDKLMKRLWDLLGVKVDGDRGFDGAFQPDLVWQEYNPYPKLKIRGMPKEWVFASESAPGAEDAISDASQVTSGLVEIFLPVPGAIAKHEDSSWDFTPLVSTGVAAGTIKNQDFMQNQTNPGMLEASRGSTLGRPLVVAAHIRDPAAKDATENDDESDDPKGLNVIYVADIDLMVSTFLRIRARPDEAEDINWNFENVTFLLNIIDELSGDDDFIQIRKRKPVHYTLRLVEQRANDARQLEFDKREEFQTEFDDAVAKAEESTKDNVAKFQKVVDELNERQKKGETVDPAEFQAAIFKLQQQQELASRRLQIERERLERERDNSIQAIRRQVDLQIIRIQDRFKYYAIFLPPIPPLLVGIGVFVIRRLREREGIAKSRLK